MKCRDHTAQATSYIERKMGWWERFFFKLHVGLCPPCREYLMQIRMTAKSLSNVRDPECSAAVRENLKACFHAWKSEQVPAKAQQAIEIARHAKCPMEAMGLKKKKDGE